ncbi:Methyltransferase-like protein 23 [Allomyces javanicus]|nr:Methyltransferase-like protein 23 [Allomyces javanicus]
MATCTTSTGARQHDANHADLLHASIRTVTLPAPAQPHPKHALINRPTRPKPTSTKPQLVQYDSSSSDDEHVACDHAMNETGRESALLRVSVCERAAWDVNAATTYAGNLWPCALALAAFLCRRAVTHVQDRCVLELGAGTCLPSLTAALFGAHRVVATDQTLAHMPPVGTLARLNPGLATSPIALRALDWGNAESIDAAVADLDASVDTIVGADVLFHKDVFDRVVATIARIRMHQTRAPAVVLVCHRRNSAHSILPDLALWGLRVARVQSAEQGLADIHLPTWPTVLASEPAWSLPDWTSVDLIELEWVDGFW